MAGSITNRLVATTLLAVGVCAASGCIWKGGPSEGDGGDTSGDHWVIRPTKMRVYPSTRFVESGGRPVLETRIELLDEADDTTKGVGQFHFDLLSAGRGGDAAGGRRLYSWDVPLKTLADNRRHYDPVSRAYFFRLSVDEPQVAQEAVVLRVTFRPADGGRLEAQTLLNRDGSGTE